MNKFLDQSGNSLIEVIAALVLFSLVAAGLAIAIPMAYSRLNVWRDQFNLGRYLETKLEDVRNYSFPNSPVGDSGIVIDGSSTYRIVTTYVTNDEINHTWANSAVATGVGLTGNYFNSSDFTIPVLTQTDARLDFSSPTFPPSGVDPATFSVRWVGYVEAVSTGTYTFYVSVDGDVTLTVNDQVLINQTGGGVWSGTIDLEDNVRYRIKMEYVHHAGAAQTQLEWEGPSLIRGIIPQNQLYTSTAKMTVVTVQNPITGRSLVGRLMTFDL